MQNVGVVGFNAQDSASMDTVNVSKSHEIMP
jgi:hypothetical protein